MEILDSQIHIWAAPTPERPWNTATGHAPHGPQAYTAEQALAEMDAAGVDVAVIVPPSFEGDYNDLALAAARDHPGRFLVNGRFPVGEPGGEQAILAALENPDLIGVRLTFNKDASRWIQDGVIDWFWRFAEDNGVRVSLFPVGEHLQLLGGIARRHPGLRLVVDHLGTSVPECGYDHFGRIEELAELGAHPNIAVKASALPVSFPETYSADVVRGVMDRLLPAFGPERVFWGSDYTRNPFGEAYGDTLGVFLDGIAHLDGSDQELVMGAGLREWYGIAD